MANSLSLPIFISLRCKSMSRYNSSTVARVIYSTQSGKSSLVNGPKSFPLRLFHLKPKLSLSFPLLFPSDSFFLSYSYFSVGYKVTSSPVLRNINGTPCSFDTSLELFFSPDRVRIHGSACQTVRSRWHSRLSRTNRPCVANVPAINQIWPSMKPATLFPSMLLEWDRGRQMFTHSLVFFEPFGERTPLGGSLVDAKDAADPWQKQHVHSVHLQRWDWEAAKSPLKSIEKNEQ